MMSLQTIKAMSAEAGAQAAQRGLYPKMFWDYELADAKAQVERGEIPALLKQIPLLGDHIPKGWEIEEELFCDASGFGQEDEPALTVRQFVNKLDAAHGYGITDRGQFQLYIGVFTKVKTGRES